MVLMTNPQPKNRLAREHAGQVERIQWSDPQTGFTIARLRDGHTVKGVADAAGLSPATVYRFLGRWKEDPRFGPQFVFDSYVPNAPAGRTGVVTYLTKMCDGIGEKKAAALWDAYGGEAVATLRDDPARVVADGILKEAVATEAAESLRDDARYQETKLALFDLFSGRGFQGDKLIAAAIKRWGAKAPAVIRRNPFALLVEEMPSCGFRRCDKLYTELGLPTGRLKRQMLAGWDGLRYDSSGHTWFPIQQVVRDVKELAGADARPERAVRLGLRAKWLKHHRDAAGKLWIAERGKAAAERTAADAVARLMASPVRLWPDAGQVGADGGLALSDHQRQQLAAATAGPVGILAGTPGTGKTFTAAALLRAVVAQVGGDNVKVCAPTGKAAVRCTQAMRASGVNLKATTIHSLLGLGKASFVKGDRPEHDQGNPLDCRVVVVDEMSMTDCSLAASLLDALAPGTHVLLIGDPFQLPPVGHGAPLRDLMAAGVPTGLLTEIRRNAGLIVTACARIKDGRTDIEFADRTDLDAGLNLRLVDRRTEEATAEALIGILTAGSAAFDPVWDTQVLVATNAKGGLSRKRLNDTLQPLLNPDAPAVDGNPFRVNDKVICLRNSRLSKVVPNDWGGKPPDSPESYRSPHGGAQAYVANGEIGRAAAVGPGAMVVELPRGDGEVLYVRVVIAKGKRQDDDEGGAAGSDDTDKGRGCDFDLAYAISTHKSQGSESPRVIVVADAAGSRVAGREWWYTAISRASRLCVVVGPRPVMEAQVRRETLSRRKTFLAEILGEVIAAAKADAEEVAST